MSNTILDTALSHAYFPDYEVDYLKKILTSPVCEQFEPTPLESAPRLSRQLGHTLLIKREDALPVFSFKLRGAYHKMASLPPAVLAQGVVCASAGNHAQAVAHAAQLLNCPAWVVMPVTAPAFRVHAVAETGAQLVLYGGSYEEAYYHSLKLARNSKKIFIHAYDDPDVIAGNGTIAMEILRQCPQPIDAILVPVGGGGLIAGIAAYIKRLNLNTKVIGVEAHGADALRQSLAAGERIELLSLDPFTGAAAVPQVGLETFRLCQQYVDEVITVSNDQIRTAIKHMFEESRTVLEPAGALAIAGAQQYAARAGRQEQRLVAVASGANIHFERLAEVAHELAQPERGPLPVFTPL